jgi:hypothetical protein
MFFKPMSRQNTLSKRTPGDILYRPDAAARHSRQRTTRAVNGQTYA